MTATNTYHPHLTRSRPRICINSTSRFYQCHKHQSSVPCSVLMWWGWWLEDAPQRKTKIRRYFFINISFLNGKDLSRVQLSHKLTTFGTVDQNSVLGIDENVFARARNHRRPWGQVCASNCPQEPLVLVSWCTFIFWILSQGYIHLRIIVVFWMSVEWRITNSYGVGNRS